jgi:hypothetical protein
VDFSKEWIYSKFMNLSKIVALIAWFNTFALLWVMLLNPAVFERTGSSVLTLIIFIAIALIGSIERSDKKHVD